MAEWTRSTPWRQGSIFDQEMLGAFRESLPAIYRAADIAIVVSHDCDVAASPSIEPVVEVIPGRLLQEENGSLTHAKDARRLHLTVTESGTGQRHFAEFKATDKFQVPKEQLAGTTPSSNYSLGLKELEILRRWLAARYRRHAFPDAFEKRFDKVEGKFREALKKSSNYLRAIVFDLNEDSVTTSANSDDPYVLGIYLVYTGANAEESLKVAQATKTKIEKAFQHSYMHNGEWTEIELRNCDVISDYALTYAQYLELAEWRSEGLSLRSDPFGPMS
jgi:hypothetical protein